MDDKILTLRKKAQKTADRANTHCPTCGERGMFCFCDIKQKTKQA